MIRYSIREARDEDVDRIVDLTLDFEEYLISIDDSLVSQILPKETYKAVLRQGLHDEKHMFFVAESKGSIIGFADYWAYPEYLHGGLAAYMNNLFIIEGERGNGCGTLLVREAMDDAREKGVVAFHVPVKTKNEKAIGFYKKMGIDTQFAMLETML